MRDVDRVANLLIDTYHGDAAGEAWFGPALRPLLGTVSPAAAIYRPLRGRHTIWELVLHLTANIDFVLARLDGIELELSPADHWPTLPEPTVAAWRETLAVLDERHDSLLMRTKAFSDAQLAQPVVGRPYDVHTMLHG